MSSNTRLKRCGVTLLLWRILTNKLNKQQTKQLNKTYQPNSTKPNLPNQTYQNRHTKPDLPNQEYAEYQARPTKPNLPNQTYQTCQTKHTKLNLPNQKKHSQPSFLVKTVNAWVRSVFGNVFNLSFPPHSQITGPYQYLMMLYRRSPDCLLRPLPVLGVEYR